MGNYRRGNHKLKCALKDGKTLGRKARAIDCFFLFLDEEATYESSRTCQVWGENNKRTPPGVET